MNMEEKVLDRISHLKITTEMMSSPTEVHIYRTKAVPTVKYNLNVQQKNLLLP